MNRASSVETVAKTPVLMSIFLEGNQLWWAEGEYRLKFALCDGGKATREELTLQHPCGTVLHSHF